MSRLELQSRPPEQSVVQCCAPLAAPTLTASEADATAAVFRALADPHRVRIVNVLATSGSSVCGCELTEPLGLSQPTVSHHLKKLYEAGIVDREQRGKWAFYTLRDDALRTLARIALIDRPAARRTGGSDDCC